MRLAAKDTNFRTGNYPNEIELRVNGRKRPIKVKVGDCLLNKKTGFLTIINEPAFLEYIKKQLATGEYVVKYTKEQLESIK